jgi:hypothetical protein
MVSGIVVAMAIQMIKSCWQCANRDNEVFLGRRDAESCGARKEKKRKKKRKRGRKKVEESGRLLGGKLLSLEHDVITRYTHTSYIPRVISPTPNRLVAVGVNKPIQRDVQSALGVRETVAGLIIMNHCAGFRVSYYDV